MQITVEYRDAYRDRQYWFSHTLNVAQEAQLRYTGGDCRKWLLRVLESLLPDVTIDAKAGKESITYFVQDKKDYTYEEFTVLPYLLAHNDGMWSFFYDKVDETEGDECQLSVSICETSSKPQIRFYK